MARLMSSNGLLRLIGAGVEIESQVKTSAGLRCRRVRALGFEGPKP